MSLQYDMVCRSALATEFANAYDALYCTVSIGDVTAGVNSFNKLRIKHVQLESSSYTLMPLLLEYGLYNEAWLHNKQLVHFHTLVPSETNDQVSKAYTYSNYMKCLEMYRFIGLCKT